MNRRHLIPTTLAIGGLMTLSTIVGIVAQPAVAAGQLNPPTAAVEGRSVPRTASVVAAAMGARNASAQRVHDIRALDLIAKAHEADLAAALATAQFGVQGSMWDCIRTAESGNRFEITSGAYGILISSWQAYAHVWSPYGSWSVPGEAPPEIQNLVAYRLYQDGGGYGGWHNRCTGIG